MRTLKHALYLLLSLVAAGLAVVAVIPGKNIPLDEAGAFAEFVPNLLEHYAIPGLALSVITDNKLTHVQAYGFANVERQVAMSVDTPLNVASVSKPILGITILQLAEQGRLDLDTDVNEYLPFRIANPHNNSKITLRHLATHTSGIVDLDHIADYYSARSAEHLPLIQYLERRLDPGGALFKDGAHYLKAEAGTVRQYSNLGAGVAGAVVESVTKCGLQALTQSALFMPLKMTNSSWLVSHFRTDQLGTRYRVEQCLPWPRLCTDTESPIANYIANVAFARLETQKQFHAYPHYDNPNYPDGGVHASIADLTKLASWLLAPDETRDTTILGHRSFSEMLALQLAPELSMSQRFFWRDRNGLTGHTGSDRGIYSSFYFDRASGFAVVFLMNRTPDATTEQAAEKLYQRVRQEFL